MTNTNDTKVLSRRMALRRIGLAAGAVYVAPAMLGMSAARASGFSGNSGASGNSGPSRYSRPSGNSGPSRNSRPSRNSGPSRGRGRNGNGNVGADVQFLLRRLFGN